MVHAIWKKISEGTIDPVYLLTGVEYHLFDETIHRIKKALPEIDETSIIRYDLTEIPVERIIEEADTIPLFHNHKLIIARPASFLTGQEKKSGDVEHNLTMLEKWLNHPSQTATVVFIAPYERLDGRKRITKKMREVATVVEASRLEGNDLLTWVQQKATSYHIKMKKNIAEYLVQTVGDNLALLSSEIKKIATYLYEDEEVTQATIEQLVARTPEENVYLLTDAYLAGDIARSITIYNDLLKNEEEPIMLTALIASQIRLMIHVQTMRQKGYQQNQIANALNVHWYRVKLIMENRRLPSNERLLHTLNQLATIDQQLKTRGGTRERLLELFLMKRIG